MMPFREAEWLITPEKFEANVQVWMEVYKTTRKEAEKQVREALSGKVYLNNLYQVAVREVVSKTFGGAWIHLSIRRLDREPIHDWRELQIIKNLLVGPR